MRIIDDWDRRATNECPNLWVHGIGLAGLIVFLIMIAVAVGLCSRPSWP